MTDKDLKRYYKEIDKALLCKKDEKKIFLDELKVSVKQYVEENNIDNISDVKKHFGLPQEIAYSFLGDIDITALKKQLSIKKAVVISLIVVVVIQSILLKMLNTKRLLIRIAIQKKLY